MSDCPAVPGAGPVYEFFGYWPTFHDAEVISLSLNRAGESRLSLHVFEICCGSGQDPIRKHLLVTFILAGIRDLHLDGFNQQNVMSELTITPGHYQWELKLFPCFGLAGTIVAGTVRIESEPGIPPDSVYRQPSP